MFPAQTETSGRTWSTGCAAVSARNASVIANPNSRPYHAACFTYALLRGDPARGRTGGDAPPQLPRGRRAPARRDNPRSSGHLASLNEIKQRSVLALTRRGLERSTEAEAIAPLQAVDWPLAAPKYSLTDTAARSISKDSQSFIGARPAA